MGLSKDIGLFALTVLLDLSLFVLLQALFFNIFQVTRLFTALGGIAVISSALTAVLAWLLFLGWYSSSDMLVLSTLGAITTFLGFGGIGVLFGPASADRSITAHILIYLARAPGEQLMADELLSRYTGAVILQKRFEEMRGVGVITQHDGKLKLTSKGKLLAHFYLWIIKILRLQESF